MVFWTHRGCKECSFSSKSLSPHPSIHPSTLLLIHPLSIPSSIHTIPAFLSSLLLCFLPSFLIFLLQNYVLCIILGASRSLLGLIVYRVSRCEHSCYTQLVVQHAHFYPDPSLDNPTIYLSPFGLTFPLLSLMGIVFRSSQSPTKGLLLC